MHEQQAHLEALLRGNARALMSYHEAIPLEVEMANLVTEAIAAQERGYYTPSEDESLREAYVNYLTLRASIWETVQALLPYIELPRRFKQGDWHSHLQAFSIAFCGAAMLMRSGYYLIDIVSNRPVVRTKLDEAEPRYGIERKQFTGIYDSLVSTGRMAKYHNALRFYQRHRSEIFTALKTGGFQDVATVLENEEPYFENRLSSHIKRKAKFELFSARRRRLGAVSKTMFFLFESLGSEIAELKQPLVKRRGQGKRVNTEIREALMKIVRPGDVFVTRHDDAMSNLFLPGFWPHAALYIGSDAERKEMGVGASIPEYQSIPGDVLFLEAKKDGVLFRPIEDTLEIDACVILRPNISNENLVKVLNRALSHSGKSYDFVFDFSSAEKLACTELIYRSYNGFGGIDLKLSSRAGRQCLSAEDLLNQTLDNDWFSVAAVFGVGDNVVSQGREARKRLLNSFSYQGKK
ncbi:MAG: hypothetical protein COA43_02490 [Robiginitomaculum sp.]|nr:MAG: hypothetical protein COA43_02490 [Robiginitomaculum sp.]